jgi:hypothetical protein
MKKIWTLVVMVVLCLVFFGTYVFLTNQITSGRMKVAAGEQQLTQGEAELVQGKEKLANGKATLSEAQSGYSKLKTASLPWVATLPVAGGVVAYAGNKIVEHKLAAGKRAVAEGTSKVQAGEAAVHAGKLELAYGLFLLGVANIIRILCGIGALLFAAASAWCLVGIIRKQY